MTLIHWKPFQELEKAWEEQTTAYSNRDLAIDMYEEKKSLIVKMHVPGMDPDKIDISLEDNYLKISGQRETNTKAADQHYYYKEIRAGFFERHIPLPIAVDTSQARAKCEEGVITLAMPKLHTKNGRKIKVEKK